MFRGKLWVFTDEGTGVAAPPRFALDRRQLFRVAVPLGFPLLRVGIGVGAAVEELDGAVV